MGKIVKFWIGAILIFGFSVPAQADEITFARGLCTALDRMEIFSKPCDVNGWNTSVDVWLDATAPVAQVYCKQVVDMLDQAGMKFGWDWDLRIFSPYSGENTIAYCQLTPD